MADTDSNDDGGYSGSGNGTGLSDGNPYGGDLETSAGGETSYGGSSAPGVTEPPTEASDATPGDTPGTGEATPQTPSSGYTYSVTPDGEFVLHSPPGSELHGRTPDGRDIVRQSDGSLWELHFGDEHGRMRSTPYYEQKPDPYAQSATPDISMASLLDDYRFYNRDIAKEYKARWEARRSREVERQMAACGLGPDPRDKRQQPPARESAPALAPENPRPPEDAAQHLASSSTAPPTGTGSAAVGQSYNEQFKHLMAQNATMEKTRGKGEAATGKVPDQAPASFGERVITPESNGKMDAMPPIDPKTGKRPSSAYGLGQLLIGTRDYIRKKYEVDAWSQDPNEQRLAVAYLAADNAKALKDFLGRDPTDAEQYAAWFLGSGGAKTFLAGMGKDENAPATDYASSAAINSNKDMFYKYHMEGKEKVYDAPRTAKELFTLLQKKVGTGTTPAPMPEKVKFILPTDPDYNSADQYSYHAQFKHLAEIYTKPLIRVLPAWPPSPDSNGKKQQP